jgi:hypothetical protein
MSRSRLKIKWKISFARYVKRCHVHFSKMNSIVIIKNEILLIFKRIFFIYFLRRVNFATLIVKSRTHVISINSDFFFDSISAISNSMMFDLTIFVLSFFKEFSAFESWFHIVSFSNSCSRCSKSMRIIL